MTVPVSFGVPGKYMTLNRPEQGEGLMLAPYACLPETSRGRLWPERLSSFRSPYQRDRDRIIHSSAFRG
jgi:dGTPase